MRALTTNSLPRIYADERGLKHGELTERLIGIFFNIYNELGHGFLESVYEQAFSIVLAENTIFFERQIAIPVWFHRIQIGEFRADLLVEKTVLIELKTGRDIDSCVGKTTAELPSSDERRSWPAVQFRTYRAIQALRFREPKEESA